MKRYQFTKDQLALIEGMRQPFAVYQFLNKKVVALALSDGFCELFGYDDRAEAYYDMDHNMYKDMHPDDAARVANATLRFSTEGGRIEVIYRTRKKDGGWKIIHLQGEHVTTEDGSRISHVWFTEEGDYGEGRGSQLNDALNKALREESFVRANHYDALTGLPNMAYFFELAEENEKEIERKGERPTLLYMNLSGMKFFNTKYGFAEGDRLLRAFAKLLIRFFQAENCCHIGADHFAAFTEEKGLGERLHRFFEEWKTAENRKALPVHVGVYPSQYEDLPMSMACDRAKLVCDAIKGTYTSSFSYYKKELNEGYVRQQYILENFDRALSERWIQLYLQPIIRTVNGRVCDVEALARWKDPEKGMLSPADFIPALEEAGLIYKLDLYMLDRILEAIRIQAAESFCIIPHSINLSRSDFDACDMVEEIRKRVDAAGVSRDRITVEITESVIGRDFEFMKAQVERFRKLGFPVWMDDFGSAYSSLDVLQSIRFDLIKFDMSFLRKLDEGDNTKVILTELMRMATALGLDTVCEGVETEAQVRFLQEIGCSKLQGYYYSRPIPFEDIVEMHEDRTLIETENPEESAYYESIGRVNLFDLGVIAGENGTRLSNTFSTIPIAVLEVKGDRAEYVRSNRAYQEFFRRFFRVDISSEEPAAYGDSSIGYGTSFLAAVKQCCETGSRAFFDERMPDGSMVHSFVRRIGVNPVTGGAAVAIAVLSVRDPDDSETYADIARALAADYYNIFIIDLDTNDYIEYSSKVGGEELSMERHGEDFFASARRDTMTRIYEEDRAPFLAVFSKENVLRDLDRQGVFTTTYRLIDIGTPMYVNMKITRMQGGNRLILGISIIDTQMKQEEETRKLRQERIALGRIAALAGNYMALYMVDLATEQYVEYNSSKEYADLGLSKRGEAFFDQVARDAYEVISPEDLERHRRVMTRENMLREIRERGILIHNYRLLMGDRYVPLSLRATLVEEEDGEKLIIGVNRVFSRDSAIKESEIIYTHLAHALARGYTDLYYVDMDTDELIEYHTDDTFGVLTEVRRGNDFFEGCARDAKLFVHPEDQAAFVAAMDREFLRKELEKSRVFELTYRRIKDGRTFWVNMKVSRMEDDHRRVVIAVSDIDELVRQRREEERIQEERIIYARLHALTGNFIVVYVVDPETNRYREFSATDDYTKSFAQATEGENFFETVRQAGSEFNHPEDLKRFLSVFTKKNVLAEVERSGIFTIGYRLMMDGRPVHVQMKAAMVEEKEGPRLIVGLNNIDVQVRQEEEYGRRLEQAQTEANKDALTGLRNRHAYLMAEAAMDGKIAEHSQPPFAIVIFDVNDLKKVNDSAGHQAGDQLLRSACSTICEIFKHSPVFRVGGDEFAVIAQGNDYESMEDRLEEVREHNRKALQSGGVVIACGMSKFENDESVARVFERADHKMYENKIMLKSGGK